MVETDMAIVIPSAKIYNKQNPKIRDNVIQRIEIEAVEVLPDNDYNTTVANKEFFYSKENSVGVYDQFTDIAGEIQYNVPNANEYLYAEMISNARATRVYFTGRMIFYENIKNKIIKKIYTGKDNEGFANIKYSANCTKKIGTAKRKARIKANPYPPTSGKLEKENITYIDEIERTFDETKNENVSLPTEIKLEFQDSLTLSYDNLHSISLSTKIDEKIQDNRTNLSTTDVLKNIDSNGNVYFYFDFTVLCGIIYDKLSYKLDEIKKGDVGETTDEDFSKDIELHGSSEYYFPESVSITVYGDTIGIDLSEIIEKIGEENSKKVHSIDRNELMQNSNYFFNSGENAIKTMFEETRKEYERGKETATILCSIGDYYEFGEQETIENLIKTAKRNDINVSINYNSEVVGTKITVSVNKPYKLPINVNIKYKTPAGLNLSTTATIKANELSATKTLDVNIQEIISYEAILDIDMSFKLYDKIIPMIYEADGQDRPMSTYQNGSPKVFQVLGTKIYYDGSVLQELSLQEV